MQKKKGWSPLPSSGLPLPINTLHQAPRLPTPAKLRATARLIQHPSPSPRSVHLLHIRLSSQRRPPPFSSSHRSSVIVDCRSRPLVTSEHDEARRGARGRRGGAAFLVPAAEDGDGGCRQRLVQEAGRAGRPRPRRRGILARLHEGLVAQAQAHGAPAWRRRRGARRLDGMYAHRRPLGGEINASGTKLRN